MSDAKAFTQLVTFFGGMFVVFAMLMLAIPSLPQPKTFDEEYVP